MKLNFLTDFVKNSYSHLSTFNLNMNKSFSIFFALSIIAAPSLAWGWGEGGCSYSKDKSNQDTNKTEKLEERDA